jgi:hypothetical protein
MFRSLIFLIVVLIQAPVFAQTVSPFYEDGNLYIKLKPYAAVISSHENNQMANFPFLSDFSQSYTITECRKLYAFAKHRGLENIYKISIAEKNLIDEAVAKLSGLSELEYAEKVPYKTYFATPPNDTSYNNALQWNLFKINAQVAWNFIGPPNPSQTIIAVVDDGLDINHIDLKNNLWVNDAEINGLPGIDDDGNFIIDDSLGYDFGNFDTDPSPNDLNWHHGTHVAGIAGAVTNNTTGVASIAYNAGLMAVKGSSSNLFVSNGYEAVAYAADNGADVINLSWGAPVYSITEANTILYAYFLGAVVVSAAGNTNDATVNYPAAYPHVICVAGTANNDTKSFGSTFGQHIDVSAPGVNIFSTIPGNNFGLMTGTSMASPLVAGLAALMKTFNPLLNPDQIEFMNPNFPGKLGTGRINAFKALQCINETRNQFDASIAQVAVPDVFSCSSSFTPSVALKNCGTNNLMNVIIAYRVDNGNLNQFQWTGNMGFDSLQFINLGTLALPSGTHQLKVYCTNPNGQLDWNFFNDTITVNFNVLNAGKPIPFTEDFENGLTANDWRVANPDQDITWQIKSGNIDGNPNKAAFINMFNYADIGQRDGLITPPLSFTGYDSLTLTFDYAWKRNFRQESDTLIVKASTDCGTTFPFRLGTFFHDTLNVFATAADTMDNYFNPSLSSLWCGTLNDCIELDLSSLAGNSSVLIKFETYNHFNNNLFIDNINITGLSDTVNAPSGTVITASTNAICAGELITFTASDTTNNATAWSWSFPNGTPSTATGQIVTIQFNTAGTVNVNLTAGNQAGNNTAVLSTPVGVNALPNVNILQNDTAICHDNPLQLNVTGALTYSWSPANGLSDTTGSNVTALPQQNITYIVTGTSAAGCLNYDTIHVDTTACLGINQNMLDSDAYFYFDVTNQQIQLVIGSTPLEQISVQLYNPLGQQIKAAQTSAQAYSITAVISCDNLSEGIYFASLIHKGRLIKTQKIFVQ